MSEASATPVESEIGFADSEVEKYSRTSGGQIVVSVRAWNQRQIEVTFEGVIAVADHDVGEISALVCDDLRSEDVLQIAIGRLYESPPRQHPYRAYSFLDHDDGLSLVIVAEAHHLRYF